MTIRTLYRTFENFTLGIYNSGDDRKTGGKDGSGRVKNGGMGIGCYKIGQDKERVWERDGKNYKAGRQTSGHKVTLVWTIGHVNRREKGHVGKGMIEMVIPGKTVKERKAKEKMDGFGERRHGDG